MKDEIFTKQKKLALAISIIAWMYRNDGAYKSKQEWRKEFVTMLKTVLEI